MSEVLLRILIVVHAVTSIFMAWPYYALIITGERVKLGPPRDRADDYMENIIRQQSFRCVIFQLTLLVSGAVIIHMKTEGALVDTLSTNYRLLAKVLLVLLLVGMNIYMVFYLQPRIDRHLEANPSDSEASRLAAKYRGRRRWMAAVCLWYVLMAVMLGVQAWASFGIGFIIVAAIVGAIFVLNTYLRLSPFGFI
jgi:hypothetical protein